MIECPACMRGIFCVERISAELAGQENTNTTQSKKVAISFIRGHLIINYSLYQKLTHCIYVQFLLPDRLQLLRIVSKTQIRLVL